MTSAGRWVLRIGLWLAFAGCNRPAGNHVQGYIEGEFVYVTAPVAGALETLHVQRGAQAKMGDPLFTLESALQTAERDEAERRLMQARASLEDAKKGKRPSEIEAITAQLRQAEAALELSEKELARQQQLLPGKATSAQDVDRARTINDQNRQWLAQLKAELDTARLGARSDQIAAAEANVRALEAALAQAEWELSQKRQAAPKAGLVFDTLYREGEWIAAARPVVMLLPSQNIKLRAFVPETIIANIHPGDRVRAGIDGTTEIFEGKVSYISPRAEFTPPVIYSRESRGKLVFMVEAIFEPDVAAKLHPGQPVDVKFGP
jgi:HlyD family secretion protein